MKKERRSKYPPEYKRRIVDLGSAAREPLLETDCHVIGLGVDPSAVKPPSKTEAPPRPAAQPDPTVMSPPAPPTVVAPLDRATSGPGEQHERALGRDSGDAEQERLGRRLPPARPGG